jgi:hypothetical protein
MERATTNIIRRVKGSCIQSSTFIIFISSIVSVNLLGKIQTQGIAFGVCSIDIYTLGASKIPNFFVGLSLQANPIPFGYIEAHVKF